MRQEAERDRDELRDSVYDPGTAGAWNHAVAGGLFLIRIEPGVTPL